METIYEDIAARTGGGIYIGVVGPVRTGKSTLIKRIMETAVIPGIRDPYLAERARDELPQCGSGKTIMTAEPKFVPEEPAELSPDGKTRLRVRLIDSVGYMVPGAAGAEEEGKPRMVTTPWFSEEIPMTRAAEVGTQKVMEDHCSIGIVVTTDGSIADIPREEYLEAEERSIRDMQATGKPFLVVINSRAPREEPARQVQQQIRDSYGLEPVTADCQALDREEIHRILRQLLLQFPVERIEMYFPGWMEALEPGHPVKAALYDAILETAGKIGSLSRAEPELQKLTQLEQVDALTVDAMDLADGTVSCRVEFPRKLYYEILSTGTGLQIRSDRELMQLLTELSGVKKEYDRISDALSAVKATGYGVVMPAAEDMKLDPPEILRKGGAYGVRLRAGAPSIHMIRVDIDTQISPMVGDEKQSRELIEYLKGEDPQKLWQSNIFGRSVYDLIQDGLTAKLIRLPEDVREKFRSALGRIVNEGASGLVCLIL